ncbi:MAG: transcription elongation factor GreA [Coxiellaceae bacterium]|nr:MAG: transcription elongation factor GreA [Coxiellaceae bacterium]
MTKYPMTLVGAEQLRQELERLKRVDRPQIIQAIAEARAHGDLKENAEYHAAKERQGLIEARIRYVESRLSHAHIIDVTKLNNDGKVVFGATVTLFDLENEKEVTYQIVGEDEADIKNGKISVTSPIARTMIGKYVGDALEVTTPQGSTEYEVTKVEYI